METANKPVPPGVVALVALKRSIDPHQTDPRRYEILRDDLDAIWSRIVKLMDIDNGTG